MTAGLTTRHYDWKYVQRDLARLTGLPALAALSLDSLQHGLGVPVALARWIERFEPTLKDRTHLDVVVAGAGWGPDVVDSGRWYQALPVLLGRPEMTVAVRFAVLNPGPTTYTGLPLCARGNAEAAPAALPANWAEGRMMETTLSELLQDPSATQPDLLFVSHPSTIGDMADWVRPDVLGAALKARIAVGVVSYGVSAYDFESWLLDAHGYDWKRGAEWNPLNVGLDGGVARNSTCAMLWQITAPPAEGFVPDGARIAEWTEFMGWCNELVALGLIEDPAHLGVTWPIGDTEIALLTNKHCVEVVSGAIFRFTDTSITEIPGVALTEELIAAYPVDRRLPMAYALWAKKAHDQVMVADAYFQYQEKLGREVTLAEFLASNP